MGRVKSVVVYVSGGASSAICWERALSRFGRKKVRPVFADTLIEDDDLYRFLKDLERHFQQPLTVLKDGRDPFQVFRDVRFLGNSRVDPCSKILKRDLLETFTLSCPAPRIRVYGMKADEDDRRERLRRRVQSDICWFPLAEPPILGDEGMLDVIRSWGINPPRLYSLGFPHNNCGGGCVKAGQAQWKLLLQHFPERYAWWEKKEQEIRRLLRRNVAILRCRRGGKSKPLTLRQFRWRLEAEATDYDCTDFGAACDCMGVMIPLQK